MKQEIIDNVKKQVADKFKMLDGWNVGADTSNQRAVDEMLEMAMDSYAELMSVQFAEWKSAEGWQNYDGADSWINTQQGNRVLETMRLYKEFSNANLLATGKG